MAVNEPKKILTSDEIAATLDEVLRDANDVLQARRDRLKLPRVEFTPSERIRQDLYQTYSAGSIVALDDDAGTIGEVELNREIIKKALTHLDSVALKRLAKQSRVPVSGAKSDVAVRVARALNWDSDAVASAVQAYERETSTETGRSSRLYVPKDSLDVDYVNRRISVLAGRFLKVGLARWFAFRTIDRNRDSIRIAGELISYDPQIVDSPQEARLEIPPPSVSTATVEIRAERLICVNDANAITAKAAVEAVTVGGNLVLRSDLAGLSLTADAQPNELHPISEWMIDLIYSRLSGSVFHNPNVINAKFQLRRPRLRKGQKPRPQLHAMRFDGDYVLDLPGASRVMWREKRPLADVTILVSVSPQGGETFPVRLVIEQDHVSIFTGRGDDAEVANDLHDRVIEGVAQQLHQGIHDEARLRGKVAQISRRADANTEDDLTDEDGFLSI